MEYHYKAKMEHRILLFIGLMILLIWLYTCPDPDQINKRRLIYQRLEYVRHRLVLLMNALVDQPDIYTLIDRPIRNKLTDHQPINDRTFTIVPSETATYVINKREIHLLIWDHEHNRPFDKNTIMIAAIHEVSHVLCPTLNHGKRFDLIESKLLSLAQVLNIIDVTSKPNPRYSYCPD